MINFKFIAAALLLLALAGSAIAASGGGYGVSHHEHDGQVVHKKPAQDFGVSRATRYPGWSSPSGDGYYPDSIDDNIRLPPSAHGG
jgi:hypothetical protein